MIPLMSDVRALLKAKRQEARISHPLATYTSTGQLRCVPCGTIVKHASAWNGHIGSKSHRVNAAKLKEQERLRAIEAEEEKLQGKRKAHVNRDEDDEEEESEPKKRKVSVDGDHEPDPESSESQQPHPLPTTNPQSAPSFPADFFTDASRPIPLPHDNDASDEEEEVDADKNNPPSAPTAIDIEWENFQKALLAPPPDKTEAYERATIFAEPVLASETPEGFPPRNTANNAPEADEQPEQLTEEQIRQKKDQDERELIMDRLLDEEEAQEEADAKVTLLKTRVEALKRRREAAKTAKAKEPEKS